MLIGAMEGDASSAGLYAAAHKAAQSEGYAIAALLESWEEWEIGQRRLLSCLKRLAIAKSLLDPDPDPDRQAKTFPAAPA